MNIDKNRIKQLKSDSTKTDVTVTVGKNGITDATIEELDRHLKKDKLVKVRLLKSATHELGMDSQAAELAERTRSILVDVRGGTASFFRP